MKALVIIYNGDKPSGLELAKVKENCSFITGEATFTFISSNELSRIVAATIKPPIQSTEEGDNSAIFISQMCRDIKDITKLTIDVIHKLTSDEDTAEHKAFVKACSLISQNFPISLETRRKTGFNDNTVEIIKTLYTHYINKEI